MTLCYVSGPYSLNSTNGKTQEENIAQARQIGCRLWENGFSVIVPHENTSYFEKDCNITYNQYIGGDLDMLSRCDYIVMTPDWESSKGAVIEKIYADTLGIPVYFYPNLPILTKYEIENPTFLQMIRENCMKKYRQEYNDLIIGNMEIGVVHPEELKEMIL